MKKEIREFLSFFGAGRPPVVPVEWDLRQLQYASVYFGMSGEDAVLRHMFKWRLAGGKPGRFVDIGCAAPVHISNTYLLYALGWRGLGIDPNPDFAPAWRDVRPEDVFENVGVGETSSTAYWFRNLKNIGMSKICPVDERPGPDFSEIGTTVKIERLDELFARHLPDQSIQLLSIDVEGAELGALMSNDWNRWRPEVIFMESHIFTFEQPREDKAIDYLYQQGYRLTGRIGANVILRRA
jgi:FkbM family methyltransferase